MELITLIFTFTMSFVNNVIQPLLDMATSGLSKNSEEDMVLALKALGNAAHPSSIKTLLKFLPGYTAGAEKLPIRVQSAAVQSFRLLASRDPHSVSTVLYRVL